MQIRPPAFAHEDTSLDHTGIPNKRTRYAYDLEPAAVFSTDRAEIGVQASTSLLHLHAGLLSEIAQRVDPASRPALRLVNREFRDAGNGIVRIVRVRSTASQSTCDIPLLVRRFPNITCLHLSGFAELSASHLTDIALAKQLVNVEIHDAPMLEDEALAPLRRLPNLRHLRLSGCPRIGDGAMVHITKLAKLQYLILHQTAIGDEGLKDIALLTSLKHLSLGETRVTAAAIPYIAQAPWLSYVALPMEVGFSSLAVLRPRLRPGARVRPDIN